MTRIHASEALLPDGWHKDILVEVGAEGRITSIGGPVDGADHHLDLLLPAPVNLHSHAFQRAMAGLTEGRGPAGSDSFWTWRKLMYRFLDQLSPDDVEVIAAQVYLEMAEAGFAGVAEFHYLHHDIGGAPYARLSEMSDRIAAAAEGTGFGLTHLPVFYQFGGCDGRALQGGQQRFGNDIARYQTLWDEAAATIAQGPDDWRIGVAPHSLRAVDEAGLRAAVSLAGAGPLHMHLAEQVAEVDEVLAHRGARPVEWLLGAHEVGPNWCLIHCTQMNDEETRSLAETGAVAGLCPLTESSLGDGIFNGTGFLGAGGAFGVGSDSNVQISLFEELKTLEYSQRLRDRSRAAMAEADRSTGRVLFENAVAGGARAAGRGPAGLQVGAFADMIGLTTDNEFLGNRRGDAVLDSLVFAGNGRRSVQQVWSAGRHIVQDGRHVARDQVTPAYLSVLKKLGQEI